MFLIRMRKLLLVLLCFLVLVTCVPADSDDYSGCRSDSECESSVFTNAICVGHYDYDIPELIVGECVPDPGRAVECDENDEWQENVCP